MPDENSNLNDLNDRFKNSHYVQIENENSLDRNPFDELSPNADASTNVFEKDEKDSVDITAPYDDEKALIIEEEMGQ